MLGCPTLLDVWEAESLALPRLVLALAGLFGAWLWERRQAFRVCDRPDLRREARNLGLWAVNSGVVAIAPAAVGLAVAGWVHAVGVGLFQQRATAPWIEVLVTILVLDALTYALHRAYHAWPLLWRVHRVHHSDETLSASTGVRFHVFEVALSTAVRIPAIVLLGAGPLAVAVFESLLLLASQLQHADVRIGEAPDRWLRRLVVTPNLHRVHHSRERSEADSNYGTLLTLWDSLFRSLRTDRVPEEIRVGLPGAATQGEQTFVELLGMPLRPDPALR